MPTGPDSDTLIVLPLSFINLPLSIADCELTNLAVKYYVALYYYNVLYKQWRTQDVVWGGG